MFAQLRPVPTIWPVLTVARRIFLPLLMLLTLQPIVARAQYVLEDVSDKKRYESNKLVLPYALYTPSERFGGGFIFTTSGLIQPQSDSYGLALGDLNNTYGFEGGTDDLQIKPIDRLFVSTQFGVFRYAACFPIQVGGKSPQQTVDLPDYKDHGAAAHQG